MSIADKFDAAKDKAAGKIKETVGKVTENESMVREGNLDQARGATKGKIAHAQDNVKDAAEEVHTDDTEGGAAITGKV